MSTEVVKVGYENEYVAVRKDRPFTDSLKAAAGTELPHKEVIARVREYQEDLEEFGTFAFETRKSGGRSTQVALLNEDQAALLITMFRNTPKVREFKKSLIKAFRRALKEIDRLKSTRTEPEFKVPRDETKTLTKILNAVLHDTRADEGKQTKSFHYANEAELVNWALTGNFAPIDREQLSPDQLKILAELQTLEIRLVAKGLPRDERKIALRSAANASLRRLGSLA